MDLLIAANSVAKSAADAVPTSGTPQYATDGNPVTGVASTTFPAYHYNMLMGELYNLVTAAGLTPSGSDWTQVAQAVKALVGAGSFLKLASTALQTVTGPVTLAGTTLVPSVTDWTAEQAVPAKDADARYVVSADSDTSKRVGGAGVNTANNQPWVSSSGTYYNLVYADTTTGTGSIQSIGINTDTASDYFPWLATRAGDFYNLATRTWVTNNFSDTFSSSGNDWFWMKFPSGVLIQGGNATYSASDGTTGTKVTLPTSFGAQFIIAVGNDIGSNANAVTVMRTDASTIHLLGREVTGGSLSDTVINYFCVGTAPS